MGKVIKDSNTMEESYQSDGTEFCGSIDDIIADENYKLVGNEKSEEEEGDKDTDDLYEEGKICPQCGTTTTELLLHLSEVHLEEDLVEEMLKVFPKNCDICVKCGKVFNNDYEKKEHTSLHHP